jgi:hypothetical protein
MGFWITKRKATDVPAGDNQHFPQQICCISPLDGRSAIYNEGLIRGLFSISIAVDFSYTTPAPS